MPARSRLEWLGDLELRRDGYALPIDKVLPGPLQVCAQTYPLDAAARVTLHCTTASGPPRQLAMTVDAARVGPYANNTRWCASIDAEPGSIALRVVAEDAAGAETVAELAFTARTEIALFETAADAAAWRMAGEGTFGVEPAGASAILRAHPGHGLGLYWAAIPTPADFALSAEVRLDRFDDNSGVFLRFRDPETLGYDNPAWAPVHDGLEIQIDETARPDGADVHRTGAVYDQPSRFARAPDAVPGTWRQFEVTARGTRTTVRIDGALVTDHTFTGDPAHPERARPSAPGAPRFVGLQAHTGAVSFRHIRLRAL